MANGQNKEKTGSPKSLRDRLEFRAHLVNVVRGFFQQRGYLEVQTPILLPDVCIDAHIDPISLPISAVIPSTRLKRAQVSASFGDELYLQTSPEFAMKRLMAAGSGSIWQATPAFRCGDLGPRHNPEFTMIEWYKVAGHYHDLMTEVADLVAQFLAVADDASSPFIPLRLTYREAFLEFAGFDPLTSTDDLLRERCRSNGFQPDQVDRDGLLNFLLASLVEPHLGGKQPTFLYDFPASQCALAKTRNDDPPVAERFELYVKGVEICNGYQELTDAQELLRRNILQNELRERLGKQTLPIHSRLMEAMQNGLPECTGVALGFDRLLMLAMGETSLTASNPFLLGSELPNNDSEISSNRQP